MQWFMFLSDDKKLIMFKIHHIQHSSIYAKKIEFVGLSIHYTMRIVVILLAIVKNTKLTFLALIVTEF